MRSQRREGRPWEVLTTRRSHGFCSPKSSSPLSSVVTKGLERSSDSWVPLQRALVALVFGFGIDLQQRTCGVDIMRSISKRIAIVCLLLTFWSAIAVVAHQHSNATKAAKCTVCVAAHSASPTLTRGMAHATFVVVSTFQAQPVSVRQSLVAFALSVRPPPEV
jgi:hypothetical protein